MVALKTIFSDCRPRSPTAPAAGPNNPNAVRARRATAKPGLQVLVALVLLWIAPVASAQPASSREYQIKAVFLFNFAQFVEWPGNAFASPDEALVIGVLGHDPFGAYLDEAVRGETVHGRPLRVERYQRVEDAKACHVLYISRSEAGQLPHILQALRGRQILLVSDVEGFAGRGGVIQFVTERNKVRLRINVDAARSAALTISSKLLRPAEIVASGDIRR